MPPPLVAAVFALFMWLVAIAFAIAASLIWLAPKPKHALQMQVGH